MTCFVCERVLHVTHIIKGAAAATTLAQPRNPAQLLRRWLSGSTWSTVMATCPSLASVCVIPSFS